MGYARPPASSRRPEKLAGQGPAGGGESREGGLVAARSRRSRALGGPILCPYRRLTGRSCPACGTTRSIAALVRGDLRGCVAAHPLGPLNALLATDLMVHRRGRPALLAPYLVLLVSLWWVRLRRGDIR